MSLRDLKNRETIYAKFEEINSSLSEMNFNLQSSYKTGDKPKMQVARFNEAVDRGGHVSVDSEKNAVNCDWGIHINFSPGSDEPNNYKNMEFDNYYVLYGGVRYPVTYKIHLSINRKSADRDHISFDMIINYINHPNCVREKDDIYLKFHYMSNSSVPGLAYKDKDRYGDIKLKIDDEIRDILHNVLNAGREYRVLTNFSAGYDFMNSTDNDNLGILNFNDENDIRYFRTRGLRATEQAAAKEAAASSKPYKKNGRGGAFEHKYLKYKAKYLELKNKLNL